MGKFTSSSAKAAGNPTALMHGQLGTNAGKEWARLAQKNEADEEQRRKERLQFALANVQYGNSRRAQPGEKGAYEAGEPGSGIWLKDKVAGDDGDSLKQREKTMDNAMGNAISAAKNIYDNNPDADQIFEEAGGYMNRVKKNAMDQFYGVYQDNQEAMLDSDRLFNLQASRMQGFDPNIHEVKIDKNGNYVRDSKGGLTYQVKGTEDQDNKDGYWKGLGKEVLSAPLPNAIVEGVKGIPGGLADAPSTIPGVAAWTANLLPRGVNAASKAMGGPPISPDMIPQHQVDNMLQGNLFNMGTAAQYWGADSSANPLQRPDSGINQFLNATGLVSDELLEAMRAYPPPAPKPGSFFGKTNVRGGQ